jgi:hypothetical protein
MLGGWFIGWNIDELNGRDDHVFIQDDDILGATVRSECLEMETGYG